MNCAEFANLLQYPESINASKTQQLAEVISEYPYFQAARAMRLKGLKKANSFKYNQALKKTASYTIDRKVLFEFITSDEFIDPKNKENLIVENLKVFDTENIKKLHKQITDTVNTENTTESRTIQKEEIAEKAAEILEIGKPIQFTSSESHSFNEWMKLITQKPIIREDSSGEISNKTEKHEDKFRLIDRFIESRPKIKPTDKNFRTDDISFNSSSENESIMTETLAKVYLEQKKYENAIKAYHILSLKYPKKSGFFADRIKAIKILQKE